MKFGKLLGSEVAVPCLALICLISLTLLDLVLLDPMTRTILPTQSDDSPNTINGRVTNVTSVRLNLIGNRFSFLARHLQKTKKKVKRSVAPIKDDVGIFDTNMYTNCRCQSLFSLEPCYFQHLNHLNTTNRSLKQAINNVRAAMAGAPVSLNTNIELLDTLLSAQNNLTHGRPVSNNFSSFLDRDRGPMDRTRDLTLHIPSMQCNIYNFSSEQIMKCLRVRENNISRKLKVAFIGDSQVRNLMENMVVFLKQRLNLTISEPEGMDMESDFLGKKIKKNLRILGNHLILELYWSMYINENSLRQKYSGPKKLFHSWIQNASQGSENVPEIVILDTGLWELKNKSEVHAVEDILSDIKDMKYLLGELSKVTQVLWRPIGPLKEWLATHQVPNAALDLMNQATRIALEGTGVWFWDTALMQALREIRRCRRKGLGLEREDCGDFMHSSQRETETLLANMIWNLICNRVMRMPDSTCCS